MIIHYDFRVGFVTPILTYEPLMYVYWVLVDRQCVVT